MRLLAGQVKLKSVRLMFGAGLTLRNHVLLSSLEAEESWEEGGTMLVRDETSRGHLRFGHTHKLVTCY